MSPSGSYFTHSFFVHDLHCEIVCLALIPILLTSWLSASCLPSYLQPSLHPWCDFVLRCSSSKLGLSARSQAKTLVFLLEIPPPAERGPWHHIAQFYHFEDEQMEAQTSCMMCQWLQGQFSVEPQTKRRFSVSRFSVTTIGYVGAEMVVVALKQ